MFEFENVCVKKSGGEILKNINLTFPEKSITVIIGKNGSGKSTLLSAAANTVKYTGSIKYKGESVALLPLRERSKLISFLPQVLPSPSISVESLVSMGRHPYLDFGKHLTKEDKDAVAEAIKDIGIENIKDKRLDEISGGERQKAYLAMILAQNTETVLLDEPATYLDKEYEKELYNIIERLRSRYGKRVIVVMHDLSRAAETADRIVLLDKGEVLFCGDGEECVKSNIIEKVFGVRRFEYSDGVETRYVYR